MEFKIFKTGNMPNCKRCGKCLGYWSPYQEYYECDECQSERASDAIIEHIRKQFIKREYHGKD